MFFFLQGFFFDAELSQCVDSGLARLIGGAVELVWHPLLFGLVQAMDVPATGDTFL